VGDRNSGCDSGRARVRLSEAACSDHAALRMCGADEQKVVRWLTVAASVPGFIGFAVGRTTFWDAVADYVGKRATRPEAVSRIARRYREWAAIFTRRRAP